jgi:hypothetical protein
MAEELPFTNMKTVGISIFRRRMAGFVSLEVNSVCSSHKSLVTSHKSQRSRFTAMIYRLKSSLPQSMPFHFVSENGIFSDHDQFG